MSIIWVPPRPHGQHQGRPVLTVSSRTKTDIRRQPAISMHTPNDANPLPRTQKNGA
jgi:hypothetical protein